MTKDFVNCIRFRGVWDDEDIQWWATLHPLVVAANYYEIARRDGDSCGMKYWREEMTRRYNHTAEFQPSEYTPA